MEEFKDHVVDAIIFVKITYDKYKNDPDYITTPFGMINLCMGIMMSWSLLTIIVSTLFHFEASTGFTTYALSWIYFMYAIGGAIILNKKARTHADRGSDRGGGYALYGQLYAGLPFLFS